jgi:hypothetical protein
MKNKTKIMKIRILSLAALLLFSIIPSVSALRIQSRAIESFKVSQLSYSENMPFEVRGKIWGKAPVGEINRILYTIKDASNTKTWEFSEPLIRTFDGTEELDLTFEFDFSKVLLDEQSVLFIELQKTTMNGSLTQVLAQGSMSLIFPKQALEKKGVSRIEVLRSFIDGQSLVTQTQFKNFIADGEFEVRVQVLDKLRNIMQEKKSGQVVVGEGETKDFSLLLDVPKMPGRYITTAQVFEKDKAVTGIKEVSLTVEGEFGVISALEVTPSGYLYAGDQVVINFSGAISTWDKPVLVLLRVQDASKTEVFSKEVSLETDEIGRFSGNIEFSVSTGTDRLHVSTELRRGEKTIGTYSFSTTIARKLYPAEGQSQLSFAIEQASQDFFFSSPKAKIGMIAVVALLFFLILGFFFFIRHIRHLHLMVLAFAFFVGGGHAEGITSLYPENGWIINPQAPVAENFSKLHFNGSIDNGTGGFLPLNTPIDTQVKFNGGTAVTTSFQTADAALYDFVVNVPATVTDGTYSLELEMTWAGITLPSGKLEIELLSGTDPLTIITDSAPPALSFEYFSGTTALNTGDFSNVPVSLKVLCDDATGCLPTSGNPFVVQGNFCSGGAFCETGKTDDFVLCDQVGNCTGSVQVEINQYDPIKPTLGDFDIIKDTFSAKTGLKALESYIFSLINLSDPDQDNTIVIDASACEATDSPFFDAGTVCKEKIISCAISATKRGFISQADTPATCEAGCPPGTTMTTWGTCQTTECSYTHFPFCFEMILGGDCSTFPFCFNMILN